MLNSASLKKYKDELSTVLHIVKNDLYTALDSFNELQNTGNWNSNVSEGFKTYNNSFENNTSVIIHDCDMLNENIERLLYNSIESENRINEILEQIPLYDSDGAIK